MTGIVAALTVPLAVSLVLACIKLRNRIAWLEEDNELLLRVKVAAERHMEAAKERDVAYKRAMEASDRLIEELKKEVAAREKENVALKNQILEMEN